MQQLSRHKKSSLHLSKRLIKLMDEKKLTLSGLAQQAEMAIGTVQKMTRGSGCNPTISSIESISRALGVSISSLIGQEKSNNISENSIPKFNWDTLSKDLANFKSSKGITSASFSLEVTDSLKTLVFPVGALLVFDKQKPYYDHAYVLAYLNKTKQYVFKRLIIDDPHLYLSSIHLELTKSEPILIDKKYIIATLKQVEF